MMDIVAAIEAWFLGGPVDGRLMNVEVAGDGGLPKVLRLTQSGFYAGASDEAEPEADYVYLLSARVDDIVVYQHYDETD